MAVIKTRELEENVVEMARKRVKNIFDNGCKIYLPFSGGKDSICLADIVYKLIQEGAIDPKRLEVEFIDEEAMYDCVYPIVMEWRKKFMLVGATFKWYCLETRNYNCLNSLEDDENFIYWDRYKRDKWIRKIPPFAITSHPLLNPRKDRYQEFLAKVHRDGIALTGVRASESINRSQYLAGVIRNGGITGDHLSYPMYDWKNSDVWLYIKENHLNFPDVYMAMYQTGTPANQLRISQFFAIDTVRHLSDMYEYYPGLMERVNRREPNAYIVQLYFDTDMFRRSTAKKRKLDAGEVDTKDYKAMFINLVNYPERVFKNPHSLQIAATYRKAALQHSSILNTDDYKRLYTSLMAGDTKGRTLRAIISGARSRISGGYKNDGSN